MTFQQLCKKTHLKLMWDMEVYKKTGDKSEDLKKCEAFLNANGVKL